MFNVSIPTISDEEIMLRYKHIKPVITKNGKLYYLRQYNLHEIKNTSYIWNIDEDIRKQVDENELEVLDGKDFICLHGYGYYGFFKPSIGEVLAQINSDYLTFVKAFEIIEYPRQLSDFHKDSISSIAFENGYHVSTVRLYGNKI